MAELGRTRPGPPRPGPGLAALGLAVLGLAAFFPALNAGYVADDYTHLAALESPGWSILDPMPAGAGTYFRPLIMGSLALERALASGDAAGLHHAVNLAIHLAAGLALWGMARSAGRLAGRDPGGLFAWALAALFLVHPAMVDDVAWIAGRQDSLVGLALLAGILGLARRADGGTAAWLALPAVMLPVALGAKEAGIVYAPTLVLAVFALDDLAVRGSGGAAPAPETRPSWRLPAALVGVTAAWAAAVWLRYHRPVETAGGFAGPRDWAEVLVTFPVLLAAPHRQVFLIETYRAHPWILPVGLVGAAAAVGALLWAVRRAGALRLTLLLAGIVVLPLLPATAAGGISARRAYAPLAALGVALAFGAARAPRAAGRSAPVLLVLAAILVVPAAREAAAWSRARAAANAWCAEFRRVADWPAEEPYALVTWPYAVGGVPVWSNHVGPALHHCRTGRFAGGPPFAVGVPLWLPAWPNEPAVGVRTTAPGEAVVEVRHPDVRFGPLADWRPAPGGAVKAYRTRPWGVVAVTVSWPDSLPAVAFDGAGVQRLDGTGAAAAGYSRGARFPAPRGLAGVPAALYRHSTPARDRVDRYP
ncbi:MAG TPA: hypothetical protein VM778_07370 [Gemmatimonadota bacterium]|nr:hypothetical protein [Gemmatimonadota bacterium]